MNFEQWKAEFEPVIYEDSGAECYDHETCDCEFLYTFDPVELLQNEEHASAMFERRVWTWKENGTIISGLVCERSPLLVTKKPYTEEMEIN